MFSFFAHKKEEELTVIIDIQSGLVRGSLVFNKENQISNILYVITKEIDQKDFSDSSFLVEAMLKSLGDTISILSSELINQAKIFGYNKKSIKNIHYVLSSPWVLSQSKTLTLKFDKATKIKKEFIQGIINEERKNIEKKFKENNLNKDSGIMNSDLIFIEQKIFEIKLNGYKVNEYEDKEINDLEISFAITLSSKILLNKIDAIINKNIKIHKIQYHSALLLNFIAMRILVPEKNNFVSIHVHNELTDIVVVKNSLCASLSSFPIGSSTILRKTSSILNENIETTKSSLKLFLDKKTDSVQEEKFKNIVDPLIQDWYLSYAKSVGHEDDGVFLPRSIYLSAHDYDDLFGDTIKNHNELAKIFNFELNSIDAHIIFEKNVEYNQLMGMYAIALRSMI